jgi:hypothetical protein
MKATFKLAALMLTAVLLGSSAAIAANTGPGDETHPPIAGEDRPSDKPRDEGRGGHRGVVMSATVLKVSPYKIECIVWPDAFESGAAEIWFRNAGTETIPAGSIITVKCSDGTSEQIEISQDLEPGASQGIKGSKAQSAEGYSCKATVKVKKIGLNNPTIGK